VNIKLFMDEFSDEQENLNSLIYDFLKTGQFVGNQDHAVIRDLCKNLGEYLQVQNIVTCNSGTDALIGALAYFKHKFGSGLWLVPSVSWLSTAQAVINAGHELFFVDVDEFGLMDLQSIPENILRKAQGIIPVHLYGNVVEFSDLLQSHPNLFIIEDCAQSFGSISSGAYTGTLGHVGCFSLFPTKNLGAYGDAGFCSTNNPEISEFLWSFFRLGQGKKKGEKIYRDGINSRLDPIQAIVTNYKLQNIARLKVKEKRHEIISLVRRSIQHSKSYRIMNHASSQIWPHVFVLKCVNTAVKESLMSRLSDKQVPFSFHYRNTLASAYDGNSTPIAEEFVKHIITIPLHSMMSKKDVQLVVEQLI
jgi:dTDP-4-amino-4,6-dideoxygalactose transaminase